MNATKRKPIQAGAKGARRERQARKQLEADGYAVTRAAGSLGLWDLVALGRVKRSGPLVRLVQVKSNRLPGYQERTKLGRDIEEYEDDVRGEVWIYRDGITEPEMREIMTSGELEWLESQTTSGDGTDRPLTLPGAK